MKNYTAIIIHTMYLAHDTSYFAREKEREREREREREALLQKFRHSTAKPTLGRCTLTVIIRESTLSMYVMIPLMASVH